MLEDSLLAIFVRLEHMESQYILSRKTLINSSGSASRSSFTTPRWWESFRNSPTVRNYDRHNVSISAMEDPELITMQAHIGATRQFREEPEGL